MIESIWSKTYRRTDLPGLRAVSIVTAVHGDAPSQLTLVADLQIRSHIGEVDTRVDVPMTPQQMRALASLLTAAAQRAEEVLMPMLQAPSNVVPLVPTAPPVSLYHEPESAA